MDRRSSLRVLAAALGMGLSRRARADAPIASAAPPFAGLDVRDLAVPGDRALGRRFVLAVPDHLAPGERVPLVVLLHGLGETHDPRAGVFAWLERYGLATSYERLRSLPAGPGASAHRGLAFACPYTPNVAKASSRSRALDDYAAWITDVVVPRARAESPSILDGSAHTAIDGCSLGGYVGLEVFLRRPERFAAWGAVQAAFGAHRAEGYAEQLEAALARVGPRPLHLETSEGCPFRAASVALAKALARRSVPHDLRVLPGPHDQPWLRGLGTIEMLRWHDQRPR